MRWGGLLLLLLLLLGCAMLSTAAVETCHSHMNSHTSPTEPATAAVTEQELRHWRAQARSMFDRGFEGYMRHAYPHDELKPLSCTGRVREGRGHVDNIIGIGLLTLVDALDTLAVMGDWQRFEQGAARIRSELSFDQDLTVSVFEVNIRYLGGLLSIYYMLETHAPASMRPLAPAIRDLALDLGARLLPAFDTPTGVPTNVINLKYGVPIEILTSPSQSAHWESCTACVGTLLLEFSYLSRITGNPVFETKAKRAVVGLWTRRSNENLFGSVINVKTGHWVSTDAGIGASHDSFYETLLKASIAFGDPDLEHMFNASYQALEKWSLDAAGRYRIVDMWNPKQIRHHFVDSLGAFWPGLQVLRGDVDRARRSIQHYMDVWTLWQALPERWNPDTLSIILGHYPLRPELIESLWQLYTSTRDPMYLRFGKRIMDDIEKRCKTVCGYGSLSSVAGSSPSVDDSMDSFFLSETTKYLFLLFDPDNWLSRKDGWILTTEAHFIPVDLTASGGSGFCLAPPKIKKHQYFDSTSRPHTSASASPLPQQVLLNGMVSIRLLENSNEITVVGLLGSIGQLTVPSLDAVARRRPTAWAAPSSGCTPLPPDSGRGKIMFAYRGTCSFYEKAVMAQQAGALALVVVNSTPEPLFTMSVENQAATRLGVQVGIPAILVSSSDGDLVKRLIGKSDAMLSFEAA